MQNAVLQCYPCCPFVSAVCTGCQTHFYTTLLLAGTSKDIIPYCSKIRHNTLATVSTGVVGGRYTDAALHWPEAVCVGDTQVLHCTGLKLFLETQRTVKCHFSGMYNNKMAAA